MLIAYADQFHSIIKSHYPTFNQFYPQWLQRIFHMFVIAFLSMSSDDGFSAIDYHQVASEAGSGAGYSATGECHFNVLILVCKPYVGKSEWF